MSGLAAALASGWPWHVGAFLGFGLAIIAFVADTRGRTLGATIAALSIHALLRLPDTGPATGTAFVTAAASLPVVWTALQRLGTSDRKKLTTTTAVLAGSAIVAATVFAGIAILARPHLNRGVDQTENALVAARNGDDEEASRLFRDAAHEFDTARGLLDSPWAAPARALPIVGPHAKAVTEAARSGELLSRTAADAAGQVDYDALALRRGQIDVDAVVKMQEPVADSLEALEAASDRIASAHSVWLLPVVSRPLRRFASEVERALPDARLVNQGFRAAPWLLGDEHPRSYLVLFGQPAESRFGGGFVGVYGLLEIDAGSIDLTETGTAADFNLLLQEASIDVSHQFEARYGRYFVEDYFQNVTATPDFPTTSDVAAQLYEQATGTRVDGAIYLDPHGVSALLQITGPVEVEGLDEPLTPQNAVPFLTRDVYVQFPEDHMRDPVLEDAIEAVFDKLQEGELPGPDELADALGPAVRGRRISFSVLEPQPEEFLASAGINGQFPRAEEDEDFVALRTANASPNKADSYLERSLAYEASLDPETGRMSAKATVTLTNNAPPFGLPGDVATNRWLVDGLPGAPPEGTNIQYVSLYSSLELAAVTRDGQPSGAEVQAELGQHAYSVQVRLLPGQSTVLVFELQGSLPSRSSYRLRIGHQPLTAPDHVQVAIRSRGSSRLTPLSDGLVGSGGEVSGVFAPSEDLLVALELD